MQDLDKIRKEAAARRDALGPEIRQAKAESIWKLLVEMPEFQAATQALFYMAIKTEVDTTLMRELCRDLGMAVFAPRAKPGERAMTFYRLDHEEDLESGPYGVLQPPADPSKLADFSRPTVTLVPGLAFDRNCNRIGYGSGYYDRFLVGDGAGTTKIGLAFETQIVDSLPVREHDVPVDWIVTESRVIRASRQ